MLNREMEQFIAEHEQEALELLKTLARIPAPSGREEARGQFCRDWLVQQGAEGVFIDAAGNVVYPVEAEGERPLEVFMAHMDVVFPDLEPLPLKEENGRLCCPGVGDDTACLVCLLLVAKYLAGKLGKGEALEALREKGLLLVCNTGEEGLGNLRGVREICRVYGSRIQSFCTFDSSFGSVVTKAVGSMRYRIQVETEGGHSFNQFGAANAIEKLAGIIQRLYQIKLPSEGRTTYNVGTISGGTSVNTIAQHAEMLYEFRSDTAAYLEYMEQKFLEVMEGEKRNGLSLSWELLGQRPCGGNVDPERARRLLRRATEAVERYAGKKPLQKAGSTDCNIPLSLGIPSICVGCYEGKGAHTREEYVETASLKKGYRVAFDMIFGGEG